MNLISDILFWISNGLLVPVVVLLIVLSIRSLLLIGSFFGQYLAISKTLTKMGPMLGLMGTLIPMGPALVGLSTGDIASMAYNMQVAFATTVVGLFSSAIGFITQQVKQRWYLQDMTNLEFLSELLTEKHTA